MRVADTTRTDYSHPSRSGLLGGGLCEYGKYPASALVDRIRIAGTPWEQMYHSHPYSEIPQALMKEYFEQAEGLRTVDMVFEGEEFVGRRDEEGYLVLPVDWD